MASLGDWLQKHGSKCVSSIALNVDGEWSADGTVTLWLPFQQLQHLQSLAITSNYKLGYGYSHMPYVRLQWANSRHPNTGDRSRGRASSDDDSYLNSEREDYLWHEERQHGRRILLMKVNPFQHVASTLTSLKLRSVMLDGFHGGLGSLTALTALQHLDLQLEPDQQDHYNCHQEFHGLLRLSTAAELGDVLGQLTSITHLRLQWQMDDGVKEALGGLSNLRELHLHPLDSDDYRWQHTSPVTPLRLPLALTRGAAAAHGRQQQQHP
jgi:hypothetical protein